MNAWKAIAPPAEMGVGPPRDEEDELRRALGVESVYGFHVESGTARRLHDHGDLPLADDLPLEAVRRIEAGQYPCLDGYSYTGCLGLACPLERCWTGGVTISYAHQIQMRSRVSTALYLPGAPCHACLAVQEEDLPVPAPRDNERGGAALKARGSLETLEARGSRERRTTGAERRTTGAERRTTGAERRTTGAERRTTGAERYTEEDATLRRVTCGRGLWAHPISLSSFVLKHIPMLDESEPEQCPGFVPRSTPHPEVAAHLERRREQARRQREERREREQER